MPKADLRGFPRSLTLLLLPLFLALSIGQAGAQTLQATDAAQLQRLVAAAQSEGAKIVVIETPAGAMAASAEAPGLGTVIHDRALEARSRLRQIIAGAADFPARAGATITAKSAEGDASWPILVILFAALFLLIGSAIEWLFHIWGRAHFRHLFNPTPQSHAEKIAYLLLRGAMQLVGIAIQTGVALLLALAMDEGLDHLRTTHLIIFGAVASVRALSVFFRNLLAYDTPSHRLLALSDRQAVTFHRGLLTLSIVIALAGGTCLWMEKLDLDWNAHLLALLGAMTLSTLLIVAFAVWQRDAVASMILGPGEPAEKPVAQRLLARVWHLLAGLYFVVAWAVASIRLVLELPNALGLVTGPVLIVFAAIAAYGVALLLIEWFFARRGKGGAGAEEPAPPEETTDGARPATFKDLARSAAGLIVVAMTLWSIFDVWGLDIAVEGGILHSLWEVLLVGFMAYLAFQSVKIFVDRKIEEEGGFEAAEPGEEGGAKGSSRLATLLPLFRNFLFIVIAVIAGMIALSEMGVDIAPLFAGAGVIGLAIGFGAQTLIRDIFSGAFFLMDDAFRKGEYIDIGTVKGTVERISIRSLQLRHHMGPLHTVPFGEVMHLTNYSRDWVMMKLPLRLTYDTDVEKVRKLIKNLGKELLEHPEEGHKFLQPLKSQGVYKMEDSAMILRVKYMTKPGDQFTTRKLVYAKIRELFEKEGIHFAHREVTVRVAETPNGRPLTEADKEAIAGAVAPVPDEPGLAKTGTGER